MRNDYGTRWTPPRFKGSSASKGKKQGANARLDESLGMRRGKESTKSEIQNFSKRKNVNYFSSGFVNGVKPGR